MIRPADLTKEEKKLLDEKHEEDMKIILKERSGAYQRGVLLSEVTGRRGFKVEAHHILGRGIPDGFRRAPDVIKEFWPHIPPGCLLLTTAEHRHAEGNSKMMRPLLLRWVLVEYAKEVWQGLTYPEWLNKPPYVGWLRRGPREGKEEVAMSGFKAEINRSCTPEQAKSIRESLEKQGWVEGVDFIDHTDHGTKCFSQEEMDAFREMLAAGA